MVYKARNGQALLEQIKSSLPHIIIADIRMPLVSGIEVAKYVYENKMPIKVIIISSYAEVHYVQEAIKYDIWGNIIKSSVNEMLPEMIEKAVCKLSIGIEIDKEKNYSDDIWGKLQNYLEEHCTENLNLSKIAKEIHANGSYLSRLYKKKTGQNLFWAINKMKMEKAKKYMKQGMKIYEVAQLVGFDDVSYFPRVFRKYEGCIPREYENGLRRGK